MEPDTRNGAISAARHVAPSWDAGRSERNLARAHARVRGRTRAIRATVGVALVVLSVVAIIFARGRWPSQVAVAINAPAANDGRTVRFNDGSSVQLLDAQSNLDVGAASDHEIDVTLRTGSGHFDVAPRADRRFIVHAGAVDVIVVGTNFRVTRGDSRVHVAVDRGRVEVHYPAGVRVLSAGEASWFPPQPEAPAAVELPVTVGSGALVAAAIPLTPADLMTAADSARLSNHPAQAVPYLERLTREFPRDSRAPLAAFTLGRILLSQLGRPVEALDAFALSRRLAPGGALAEDALAREAEASELAGKHDRARALLEEYARRYPRGRHLQSVQQHGGGDEPAK